MPAPFVLNQSPLDSPFYVLDGDGSLAIPGRDILVELDAWDIAGAALTTFYFGSKGYNHPTAPDYYVPRLEQPLNFRRDIYSAATTGGASRASFGELRLINNDGALDFLRLGYALSGQRVRMLIGDVSQAYETFEALIVGRVQQAFFNTSDLTIQLRDRLQDLTQPIQVNKYAGTNVLPDGLEGAPTEDIKDKPKPLLFGSVYNATPPCVNTARLIYQVNDGPLPFLFVFDNGAALTLGALYTDQADMEANAPAAGNFRVWLAGGYFRLGTTPAGTITCNAVDTLADAELTAAQVAVRIVTLTPPTGEGGVDSADVDFDDVDELDAANSSGVGIWLVNNETYAQALDAVLPSVGAWYGFDRFGRFRLQRLDLPVLPYVLTLRLASRDAKMALGEYPIVAYRFMPSNDPERGTPTWRVTLEYARNYTVQPPSVTAGVVSQERRNFLGLATRTEVSESEAVRDVYPLAVEKTVPTLLAEGFDLGQSAAADEATRLLTMFGTRRDFLEIDTILRSDLIALVDIGDVVNIVLPRFDYAAGRIMRIIGMQYNAAAGILTLALWG